eukprot:6181759-Pleurochrysis_carterae.AAC.1
MADVLPVAVKLTDKSVHKTDLSLAHASQKLKLSSACVKELKIYCDACHPLQLYRPYSHCQPAPHTSADEEASRSSVRQPSAGRKRGRRAEGSDDEESLSKDSSDDSSDSPQLSQDGEGSDLVAAPAALTSTVASETPSAPVRESRAQRALRRRGP